MNITLVFKGSLKNVIFCIYYLLAFYKIILLFISIIKYYKSLINVILILINTLKYYSNFKKTQLIK